MPWIFLFMSLVGIALVLNAFRPVFTLRRVVLASFFAGWLTSELALQVGAFQGLFLLGGIAAGALAAWPGWVALAVTLGSWVGLGLLHRRALGAEVAMEAALGDGLGLHYDEEIHPSLVRKEPDGLDWRRLALPFPIRHPEVEAVRHVRYHSADGIDLHLDVWRHRRRPSGCPTLLYIHGGGWVIGDKEHQGLPLMQYLAARGWVCFGIDYRLSPRATFPDHLVDVKHAIRWVREEGAQYGADPAFLVVAGGSAGGHLAALTALTAGDTAYQPGFETVDTSVAGCIGFYGVYDFMDRFGHWPSDGLERLLERYVMKSRRDEDRLAWERASPMSRVHAEAPPFLLVHGDRDNLVPVADARRFAELLRTSSQAPVVYAEIPGGHHAFEVFPSPRSELVLRGIGRFADWLYSRYLARQAVSSASG